ncbi:hypothetical protein GCM10009599_08780 [Luteococcus peritonei]
MALAVGLTAACQAVYHLTGTGGRILSLDRELSLAGGPSQWTIPIPALLSFLTLVGAGLLWWRAARVHATGVRLAGLVLSGFLLFMALDELLGIHEQVGHLLRVKWLVAYAPLILLAGLGSLYLVARLWQLARPAALALLLGGCCWVLAQTLEILEWNGERHVSRGYTEMMTVEEIAETLGSGLFGLAAARLAQRRSVAGSSPQAEAIRPDERLQHPAR